MQDTIYESHTDNNINSSSKFTAAQLISQHYLYTNSYGQKVLALNLDGNGLIVQFGKAKKDTITGRFNSMHASQIFVNGILKYDDSKPAHPGQPWFTLVK